MIADLDVSRARRNNGRHPCSRSHSPQLVAERPRLRSPTRGSPLSTAKKQRGACRSRLWTDAGSRTSSSLSPRPAGLVLGRLICCRAGVWRRGGAAPEVGAVRLPMPSAPLCCRRPGDPPRVRFRPSPPGRAQGSRDTSGHRPGEVRARPKDDNGSKEHGPDRQTSNEVATLHRSLLATLGRWGRAGMANAASGHVLARPWARDETPGPTAEYSGPLRPTRAPGCGLYGELTGKLA